MELVIGINASNGIINSLDAKLESVKKALEDLNANNDGAAINSLQAFINAVEAQRDKQITTEQADYLIANAQRIIASLTGD